MTESTAAGKWIACMNYLQQNLPNQEYDTWFAPLRFVALTGHTLTISTPNKFVGDYIGKIYMETKARPRYIISERTWAPYERKYHG